MANLQLRSIIRQLRHIIVAQGGRRAPSDAQLLQAFIQDRDEGAMEMLVWRHGAMVLNLCRRVLRDEHQAEDAFQATFLVFVRKADSIGKCQSVGSWLCKVAYRIAQRLRRKLAKHPEPWAELDDFPARASAEDLIWRDLRSVLDEEINRLPEKYRAPIVLCYLQGHTHREVTELLRCPPGTFRSRLARGLEQLRSRLARRGLAMSAGWLATSLSVHTSSATVPAVLVDTTTKAAMAFAAGHAVRGLVSSSVAALTQGDLRAMFMTKLKKVVAMMFAVAVLGMGAGSLAQWAQAGSQQNQAGAHQAVTEQAFAMARIGARRYIQDKAPISFVAKVKKVEGNKVTINRSDQDNKFDDQVLTTIDKVVVKILNKVYENGYNNAILAFVKEVDGFPVPSEIEARITINAKNFITEIDVIDSSLALKKLLKALQDQVQARKDAEVEERFLAKIKKIEGNKVTINRSDKDNKFDDQVLTAIDKVVIKIGDKVVDDGLKNAVFAKEVQARIGVNAKNNIAEIQVLDRFSLLLQALKELKDIEP